MADCHRPARFVMLSPDTPRRGGRMSAAPPTRRGGRAGMAVPCHAAPGVRRAGTGRGDAVRPWHDMRRRGGRALAVKTAWHDRAPCQPTTHPPPQKGPARFGSRSPSPQIDFPGEFRLPLPTWVPLPWVPEHGSPFGVFPYGSPVWVGPSLGPPLPCHGDGVPPRTGAAKLQARGG